MVQQGGGKHEDLAVILDAVGDDPHRQLAAALPAVTAGAAQHARSRAVIEGLVHREFHVPLAPPQQLGSRGRRP